MHAQLLAVTERIINRSKDSRARYLEFIEQQQQTSPTRDKLSCGNQAHTYASAPADEKLILKQNHRASNIGIVSAYNDMLSAHAPYYRYPEQLKAALKRAGHVGQMAGGVPAMCDGVTQGQLGMELSLFSRDVIALSTAVSLSHQVFDGALLLGICDKIVPGLLMAALRFGHIPAVFVPAGPMSTGISNSQKANVRRSYASGEIGRDALLDSEMQAYHEAGTCTFYGTANSNQMLVEVMGLQLPGSSFVHPQDPLRAALTDYAAQQVCEITAQAPGYMPIGQLVDERTMANAIVGLLATGGSTNHSIHLLAIARMAGIKLDWQDFADLSDIVPLLARVYPNGEEDINAFHQAGATPFIIKELLDAGLLHENVNTILGKGLRQFTQTPALNDQGELTWHAVANDSLNPNVLAKSQTPFMSEGGLKLLEGNLGRAIMKVSAVSDDDWAIEAPARVFMHQQDVLDAYHAGTLNQDVIVVVAGQGPAANGMPELHQLTPALSNIKGAGFKVALVTDGRLSGASGNIPAAIHVTPEAEHGGAIAQIQDGDLIRLDAHKGTLDVLATGFEQRPKQSFKHKASVGMGRELFSGFRGRVGRADAGALSVFWSEEDVNEG